MNKETLTALVEYIISRDNFDDSMSFTVKWIEKGLYRIIWHKSWEAFDCYQYDEEEETVDLDEIYRLSSKEKELDSLSKKIASSQRKIKTLKQNIKGLERAKRLLKDSFSENL